VLGLVLNMVIDNDVNAQRFADAGVVADIVRLCSQLFELAASGKDADETIMAHALDTLLILSTQPSGQKGLSSVGAASMLANGMKVSSINSNVGLMRSMIAVAGNLATDSSQCKIILEAQGVPAVVSAMKLHHGDTQLQEAAAGAIRNFCVTEEGRLHAANAGAIDTVIDVMQTHAESPRVLQNGISALINLSQSNNKNKALMRRNGVIPLVKASLTAHPSAQQLQEVGMFFLQELGVKSL